MINIWYKVLHLFGLDYQYTEIEIKNTSVDAANSLYETATITCTILRDCNNKISKGNNYARGAGSKKASRSVTAIR